MSYTGALGTPDSRLANFTPGGVGGFPALPAQAGATGGIMSVSYAGMACLDPAVVRQECLLQALPVDWVGLPSSYSNPLRLTAGRGWVLLTRGALSLINQNAPHDLVMGVLDVSTGLCSWSVTHKSLHVVEARCVTPGAPGDPRAAYLVELSDVRRLARNVPLNNTSSLAVNAFNIRTETGDPSFAYSNTNGGTPWTWDEMYAQLWSQLQPYLGNYPGLPAGYTPDGTPEGFALGSMTTAEALDYALDKGGLAVAYNSTTATFRLVRPGVADPAYTAAVARYQGLRLEDADPVVPAYGRIPATVYVLFPIIHDGLFTPGGPQVIEMQGDGWWWTVPVSTPDQGVEPNSAVQLVDDLAAYPNTSSGSSAVANTAALAARASFRAGDYLTRLRAGPARLVYAAPLADGALQPGGMVTRTRWADTGEGMTTEVVRRYDGWHDAPAMSAPGRGLAAAQDLVLAVPVLSRASDPAGTILRTRQVFSGAMAQAAPGQAALTGGGSSGASGGGFAVTWVTVIYDTDEYALPSTIPGIYLVIRPGIAVPPWLVQGQVAVLYSVGGSLVPVSLVLRSGAAVVGRADYLVTGSGTLVMTVSAVTNIIGAYELDLNVPPAAWVPGDTTFTSDNLGGDFSIQMSITSLINNM